MKNEECLPDDRVRPVPIVIGIIGAIAVAQALLSAQEGGMKNAFRAEGESPRASQ